jgi:glutathione-specific gamma-glutamylcyclotransferase
MLWVFAYGSLMFRPDFPFVRREIAGLPGFERRFYQGSTDHRGVPGAPGRVVTLVPSSSGIVWGVAYGVSAEEEPAVLAKLDYREKGGYSRMLCPVVGPDGQQRGFDALAYAALPGNPDWLGPAPLEQMAAQIGSATGPSGANRDYLLGLARTLREHAMVDEHVFALADLVAPGW